MILVSIELGTGVFLSAGKHNDSTSLYALLLCVLNMILSMLLEKART